MKIGLIADTHDRMGYISKAVEALNEAGVEHVLHAGDYVAPFALRPLAGLQAPWIGVYGNNDGEKRGLSKSSGGRIEGEARTLSWAGKRIALVHDEQRYFSGQAENDSVLQGDVDVVVCGHTHEFKVTTRGSVLVVNPGECCGYLSGQSTVGVLDTSDLSVERIVLTG
jgi:hypothetical protein